MSDADRQRAREAYEAGEFRQCREAALAGLAEAPDDVELLRLAGRAGVELGSDDAIARLRRVSELQPDADAWRDLGDALATEGLTDEANDAFRKVLELEPGDELALTNLGHLAYASGNRDEGVSLLSQAAEHAPRTSTAAISLVDMYRTLGQPAEALAAARRLAEAAPEDVVARLDVAELSLDVGELDAAAAAFEQIRELDDVPGHEAYPLHGLIVVELRREGRERALELAKEAAALESQGRSAEVLAFLAGPGEEDEEPPPTREEVDAALAASLYQYRRLLVDARPLAPGTAT